MNISESFFVSEIRYAPALLEDKTADVNENRDTQLQRPKRWGRKQTMTLSDYGEFYGLTAAEM